MADLKIGNIPIVNVKEAPQRLSMLLWGPAGCGKTTLAATAPGKKLLINFDPDGAASITNRDDVDLLDLAPHMKTIGTQFDGVLARQIKNVLPNYDTVIVDSLTNVQQTALTTGVSSVKGATIARPSPGAYQVRNAYTLALMSDLLMDTGALNKHIIFTAHEATPDRNDEGVVIQITLMLGGQLPNQGPCNISEVWAMYDNGKDRRIAVRPCRARTPMKTRMFNATEPEFKWAYDAQTGKGLTLASLYEDWKSKGFSKINLPS
jgi:phage nucleotide-binding protein